jgi:hypothetical protein
MVRPKNWVFKECGHTLCEQCYQEIENQNHPDRYDSDRSYSYRNNSVSFYRRDPDRSYSYRHGPDSDILPDGISRVPCHICRNSGIGIKLYL